MREFCPRDRSRHRVTSSAPHYDEERRSTMKTRVTANHNQTIVSPFLGEIVPIAG